MTQKHLLTFSPSLPKYPKVLQYQTFTLEFKVVSLPVIEESLGKGIYECHEFRMLKKGSCILCTRCLGHFLFIESFSGKRKVLHEGYEYLNARAQQNHDLRPKELELQERRLAVNERQMAVK